MVLNIESEHFCNMGLKFAFGTKSMLYVMLLNVHFYKTENLILIYLQIKKAFFKVKTQIWKVFTFHTFPRSHIFMCDYKLINLNF